MAIMVQTLTKLIWFDPVGDGVVETDTDIEESDATFC